MPDAGGHDGRGERQQPFTGTATVTLAAHTVFGPPGPAFRDVPYTAMVRAGGPGTGYVDLEILGMSFKGTVEHGQIQIAT